jgi:hypothetical protein
MSSVYPVPSPPLLGFNLAPRADTGFGVAWRLLFFCTGRGGSPPPVCPKPSQPPCGLSKSCRSRSPGMLSIAYCLLPIVYCLFCLCIFPACCKSGPRGRAAGASRLAPRAGPRTRARARARGTRPACPGGTGTQSAPRSATRSWPSFFFLVEEAYTQWGRLQLADFSAAWRLVSSQEMKKKLHARPARPWRAPEWGPW